MAKLGAHPISQSLHHLSRKKARIKAICTKKRGRQQEKSSGKVPAFSLGLEGLGEMGVDPSETPPQTYQARVP